MADSKKEFYIVEANKLPEIFIKTVQAKKILLSGKVKTIGEAVGAVGLSRSAYYKYKDSVRLFYETEAGKVFTFYIVLEDIPGVLSAILKLFAEHETNILTINQSIPINGQAAVSVSAQINNRERVKDLLDNSQSISGVIRFEVLGAGGVT